MTKPRPHRAGLGPLRAGDGQRHLGAGADEHGAARLPDGGNLAGQHPVQPALQEATAASRPSISWWPIRRSPTRPGATAWTRPTIVSAASSMASRQPRTATMPSCCTSSPRSKAPEKAPSSCRTACCSGAAPRQPFASEIVRAGYIKGIIGLPANLFYGTGIPACILVLDKEDAAGPQGHLHGRCQQGLHQGRQQEPPARAGHPQNRRHLHPSVRNTPVFAHGAVGRD